MMAAQRGQTETVRMLLEAHATMNVQSFVERLSDLSVADVSLKHQVIPGPTALTFLYIMAICLLIHYRMKR